MTTESDYTIRLAGLADLDTVIELCEMGHEENAIFSLSPEKYQRRIIEAISTPEQWQEITTEAKNTFSCVILAEKDGHGAGIVVLNGGSQWYSDDQMLFDIFNFVAPEHRRSDCAKRLVEFSKSVADQIGLPLLFGVLSTTRTEAKLRLYRRQMTLVGGFFLHVPPE